MGQYYHPVNMELKEHLYSHALDCGLKMGEILWSCHRLCDAMAIFLAHNERETQQPGDLFRDGVTGRWAGHPVLYIGDYADNGDLPSWRWPVAEDELYGLLGCNNEPDDDGVPREYIEVSDFVRPVIERYSGYANMRNENGMTDSVPLLRRPGGGFTVDFSKALDYQGRPNQYLRNAWSKHLGTIEARTDLTMLSDEEIAIGQRRLIVNLDKLEFMDPASFDEVPTLAGMMRGMVKAYDSEGWSSIQAMNSMLFYNGARGGGDDEGEMVGRWRGDRLVIIGEQETSKFPSIEQVRAGYEDISVEARENVPA